MGWEIVLAVAAAATTRGFSKATLSRSIGSVGGRMSCKRRARSVQSRPPEKRIARRVEP